jgi:dihydroorotase
MKLLLKSIKIFDKTSKYHLKKMDIFIESGEIREIGINILPDNHTKVFKEQGACVSTAWMDSNFHIFEPGYEYREDFNSGLNAAEKGGFSNLCLMPNTIPPIDNSAQLAFAQKSSKHSLVDVFCLGAVSQGTGGKDIAEIYDMHHHGAVGFTDGIKPIHDAGLMERALWYVKKFDGVVLSQPNQDDLAGKGQMNEGLNSTKLGLEGVPKLAEELMVSRDLYLLEHTQSRLHFINISTKKSVDLIRSAKKKGLNVTAGVNVANLFFEDSELLDYDTNFKVTPHLREKEDISALLKGLADGTIDVISSGHLPLHLDEKKLEFDHSAFGMSTIDCAFRAARKATEKALNEDELVEKLTNAYGIFKQNKPLIQVGNKVDLTLFSMQGDEVFTKEEVYSKGKNNPFVGRNLLGKVFGIIKGNKTNLL